MTILYGASIALHLAATVWLITVILSTMRTLRQHKDKLRQMEAQYLTAQRAVNNELLATILRRATPPDDLEDGVPR